MTRDQRSRREPGRARPDVDAELRIYVVERCLPGLRPEHRGTLRIALEASTRRMTASGRLVRHVGSVFVPVRARCFCYFEATTTDSVRRANETALVPFTSIDEAILQPSADADGRSATPGLRPARLEG